VWFILIGSTVFSALAFALMSDGSAPKESAKPDEDETEDETEDEEEDETEEETEEDDSPYDDADVYYVDAPRVVDADAERKRKRQARVPKVKS